MSLWRELSEVRKDGSSQNETILDPPGLPGAAGVDRARPSIDSGLSTGGDRGSHAAASTPVFEVSEPEYFRIGFEEWVPAVYRGLDVVFPAKDWEITPSMVDRLRSGELEPRALTVGNCHPCPICQCPLFWEAIGDRSSRSCVQCKPPSSPAVAEDLWMAEPAGWRRVSNDPRWQRVAFETYERGRRAAQVADAARVAASNEGF